MFIAIAIHHAAAEHTDEFVAFMRRVIEATQGAPGLLEIKACREPIRGFLAGFSRWESADAFQAALPTITSLAPLRKPEWTTQPDELITLIEVGPPAGRTADRDAMHRVLDNPKHRRKYAYKDTVAN